MSWQIDLSHSQITFSVRHMMISNVRGRFENFTGDVDFNETDPARSAVRNARRKAAADALASVSTYVRLVACPLPTSVMRALNLESNSFDIEPEITAKLARTGHSIYEVPISYQPRREDKKMRPLRDGFRALRALFKYRFEN